MVKIKDIFIAINKRLVEAYPSYTVYAKYNPKDFKRPSFLLEFIRNSQIDICRTSVEKTVYFTITCFTKVDKYNYADPEELAELQEGVMQLFNEGYVTVGDRAIKVKSSAGCMDDDCAYVDLQFEFTDNRANKTEGTPIMAEINSRMEVDQ